MMTRITFSAEERLICLAREKAKSENHSLSNAFVSWLEQYVSGAEQQESYKQLMRRLSYVRAGRHFSREEMES